MTRTHCAIGFAMLLCLPACNSGQPSPAGYNCGTPQAGHCYAIASLSDSGQINGYKTEILVSANTNPGDGFLTHEMWLDTFGPYSNWIEAGYTTDWVLGSHYFWAENTGPSGLFINHDLGMIPQSDYGMYVNVAILNMGGDDFRILVRTPTVTFDQTTTNAMWQGRGYGYVNIGTELQGSRGASATSVLFLNNGWFDINHVFHFEAINFAITQDKPPYAGYLSEPSETNSNGGTFLTECCLPLTTARTGLGGGGASSLSASGQSESVHGARAVQPTLSNRGPVIREEDVINFALRYPIPKTTRLGGARVARTDCGMTTANLPTILISSVRFLGSDRNICYVELDGSFFLSVPPSPERKRSTLSYAKAFEIFDAKSGNLLLSGLIPD
jgi:hypothetical protein